MKNNFYLTAILVFVTLILSCKKGPDDPFLSFRSRTSRLEGDWNISEYKETELINDFNTGYITNKIKSPIQRIITIENNLITATYSDSIYPLGSYSVSNSQSPIRPQFQTVVDYGEITTNNIKFTKGGTWERTVIFTISTTTYDWSMNQSYTAYVGTKYLDEEEYTYLSDGIWEFIKEDGYKNKECIQLTKISESEQITRISVSQYTPEQSFITLSTGTNLLTGNPLYTHPLHSPVWEDGTGSQIWRLTGLHNKKLNFELTGDFSGATDTVNNIISQESGIFEQ